MSADRLREAARVLRERAEAADTPGPWQEIEDDWSTTDVPAYTVHGSDGLSDDVTGGCLPLGDAAYIATMHPGVGLALADWLDDTAASHDFSQALDPFGRVYIEKATAVADLILGTTA